MARTLSLASAISLRSKPQQKRLYRRARARRVHADALSTSTIVRMTVLTFGLYMIYWQYRSWERVRIADRLRIRSGWRAIFWPFYGRRLLSQIDSLARRDKYRRTLAPGQLHALAVIAPALGWLSLQVPSIISWALLSLVSVLLSIYVMITGQEALNAHLARHVHSRKTGTNFALIFLLVVPFGAILIGERFARWTIW